MSNQELIKDHLEKAYRVALASGHTVLAYLIEMALLENAESQEFEDDYHQPTENGEDMRKTLRVVSN